MEKAADAWEALLATLSGGSSLVYRYILPFSERVFAAGIHVGTRGLVYLSYHTASPLPFLMALAPFLFADGILGYRLIYEGRVREPRVLRQMVAGVALLAALVWLGFLLSWPHGR